MAVSTCQKFTFVSCIVLCMSLFLPKMFLPREKKEKVHTEVGPGHFPPIRHGYSFSEDYVDWNTESHYSKHYNTEAIARTKSVGKPNLLVQVIPAYGFGIFLYIIYLFFKLTSKGKPHRQRCRFPILQPEHIFEEMPTCQLPTRTSEKMREKIISKVVHPTARSRRGTRKREEKTLKQLREITQMMRERQLREGVTPEEEAEETPYTVDWEGYPEETYPEYEFPCRRRRYPSVILEEPDQVIPTAEELAERMEKEEEEEEPADNDNKMKEENKEENDDKNEDEEEEDEEDADSEKDNDEEDEEDADSEKDNDEEDEEDDTGEDQPCLPKNFDEDDETLKYSGEREEKQKPSRRRQITFSDHRHVFHYPKGGAVGCKYEEEEEEEHEEEEEDEDNEEEENGDEDYEEEEDPQNEEERSETEEKEEGPLMEAESLCFNDDVECDPEEQEVDLSDFLQTYQLEVTTISSQSQSPKTLEKCFGRKDEKVTSN